MQSESNHLAADAGEGVPRHSALPWVYTRVEPTTATAGHTEPYSMWVYGAGPRPVVVGRSVAIHADDMELICRAVNSHDDLVAALRLFTRASMGSSNPRGESSIGWQSGDGLSASERVEAARAAISKATSAALPKEAP